MTFPPRRPLSPPRENPFGFGDVAVGALFTDRAAEIAELGEDVRSGQNVLVLAPRRFGKTSLLAAVTERLRADGVLVAYADLLRATSKARFAEVLARALYAGLESGTGRGVHRAVEFFRGLSLRPKVTINQDGTPSFELAGGAAERDLDTLIEQLLMMPGEVATRRGKRVVLVLDEFQEVVEIDPTLPALIRSVFQLQPEVSHVYLGSRQHLLQRVFTDVNQPLYNSAKVMGLGPISPDLFTPFIRERFLHSEKAIQPEAIAALLRHTGGHPHDTQKLCSFTWNLVPPGGTATPQTVEDALARALSTDTARYTQLWDSLTVNQRRLLEAIARANTPVVPLSEDFRQTHRLGAYATADRALQALLERGYVERASRDTFEIPDLFLRLWLQTGA